MRVKALTLRILSQLRHDRRTLGLILLAPLLILTLVYFVLESGDAPLQIGVISAPDSLVQQITGNEEYDVEITALADRAAADQSLEQGDLIAALAADEDGGEVTVYLDGSDSAMAKKALAIIKSAVYANLRDDAADRADDARHRLDEARDTLDDLQDRLDALPFSVDAELDLPDAADLELAEPNVIAEYVYGSGDNSFFDNFGAPLIGIIVFFLVFLIAGINFLGERTSGALEKLLSTPIRCGEIILGYVLGFSLLAVAQATLLTLFVVYVLGLTVAGSVWYVLLVCLLTAITALTLGILLSTLANSEFQMMQFIPIVILPQIFLCGLFSLTPGWQIVGHFMPLWYTTDALTEVMLKGSGFTAIAVDCGVLLACSLLFMLLNTLLLRRQRQGWQG